MAVWVLVSVMVDVGESGLVITGRGRNLPSDAPRTVERNVGRKRLVWIHQSKEERLWVMLATAELYGGREQTRETGQVLQRKTTKVGMKSVAGSSDADRFQTR
jgi:hypothetical protein